MGIIGLSLGLGCITVVMEEGQRDYWFASPMISWLTILSAIGLVMLIAGQRLARRPVIDLRILLEREFGSVFLMGLVIGAGLYGVLYIIPQFLAAVPDYNAYQSGLVVLISGLPTLAIMPFFPLLVQKLDLRIAIALGLFLFSLSCWIDVNMTADTVGANFTVSQILRGFGQGFAMLFLNQAASSAVSEDKAEDASGLFNAARNLGGSMGLAAIATLQDQRSTFHVARLNESLDANSILLQQNLAQNGNSPEAMQAQLATLSQTVKLQATVMTFNDLFFVFSIALFVAIPLVLLLRPLPKGQGMSAMH
ncbi:MFS transporter [Thioclava sp. BHET1]|nr:MFS transporter [Thioclava sp. BHET1]